MDIDKFLKSQTLKTGIFVLLILLILLIVFKMGVIHGHKKSIYSHKYDNYQSQIHGGKFFGYRRGAFNKDMYGELLLKKKLITDKIMLESKTGEKPGVEELTQ